MPANPNARKPDESFEGYKARRRAETVAARQRVGRVVWDSDGRGPYLKAKHGELGRPA